MHNTPSSSTRTPSSGTVTQTQSSKKSLFKAASFKKAIFLPGESGASLTSNMHQSCKFIDSLLSTLPSKAHWLKSGVVERRTVHANIIWRERLMILTHDTIFFARPDSDVVVDRIALDEVVSVERVDNLDQKPIAAAKKVPFNAGSSTPRKGFLGLTDSSENASFAKTKGAFEIRVQSDGISRSYFVRVENLAECSAWLHEIHAKILDSQKFSRNRGQYMVQVVQGATSVANNIYLRSFICCVILVEFVLSILESERVSTDREAFSQRLEPVDIFFCTIFGLELLVNILAQWKDWLGYSFFRKGSNWIAVATFVCQLVGILSSEFSYKYLKVLRVVRIFDVGRAFAALASCHMVLKAIRQALTPVTSALTILFLVTSIFSVFAVHLFGDEHVIHFGNFSLAFFTMFQVCTGDGWAQYITRAIAGISDHGYETGSSAIDYSSDGANQTVVNASLPNFNKGNAIFFMVFFFMTCICLLGVIHAILLDEFMISMQEERRRIKEEEFEKSYITTEKLGSPLDPLLAALSHFHSSDDLSNKIKELFLMIDANNSGSLDYQEIHDGLEALEGYPVKLSLEDLDTLTENKALCNARGELDLDCFERLIRHQLQLYVMRTLASAMERVDRQTLAGMGSSAGGTEHISVMLFVLKLLVANMGDFALYRSNTRDMGRRRSSVSKCLLPASAVDLDANTALLQEVLQRQDALFNALNSKQQPESPRTGTFLRNPLAQPKKKALSVGGFCRRSGQPSRKPPVQPAREISVVDNSRLSRDMSNREPERPLANELNGSRLSLQRAASSGSLVEVGSPERRHSKFSAPQYAASKEDLLGMLPDLSEISRDYGPLKRSCSHPPSSWCFTLDLATLDALHRRDKPQGAEAGQSPALRTRRAFPNHLAGKELSGPSPPPALRPNVNGALQGQIESPVPRPNGDASPAPPGWPPESQPAHGTSSPKGRVSSPILRASGNGSPRSRGELKVRLSLEPPGRMRPTSSYDSDDIVPEPGAGPDDDGGRPSPLALDDGGGERPRQFFAPDLAGGRGPASGHSLGVLVPLPPPTVTCAAAGPTTIRSLPLARAAAPRLPTPPPAASGADSARRLGEVPLGGGGACVGGEPGRM